MVVQRNIFDYNFVGLLNRLYWFEYGIINF